MDEGIVLVEDHEGEYVGLYVDGELVASGPSISERDMLEALGCEFSMKYASIDIDLPVDLEDLSLDEQRAEF